MSARLPPPPREVDLDSTDELPILRIPASPFEAALALPRESPGNGAAEDSLGITDDALKLESLPRPAGIGSRVQELEQRIAQREARIAELEQTIGDALHRELALRAQFDTERYSSLERTTDSQRHLEDAERELLSVRHDFDRREADLLAAQVEIDGQRRALAHARMEVEQRSHAFRHQAMDLAELRSRSERLQEAVQTAFGWRAADQQEIAELQARCSELQRLAKGHVGTQPATGVAATHAAAAAATDGVATELAALRSGADAARAAVAVYEEQQFLITQLQQEVAALRGRIADLEAELAQRAEPLAATQDVVVHPDIVVTQDVLDASLEESGTRPGLRALVLGLDAAPARELVRQDAAGQIRYPLGRRATIGRTPDNDIQIDTTYVSRHHAVVLSSARECVIEDLNSTNGVLVNGQRVGRQPLFDGDSLQVGNTVFTFHQSE